MRCGFMVIAWRWLDGCVHTWWGYIRDELMCILLDVEHEHCRAHVERRFRLGDTETLLLGHSEEESKGHHIYCNPLTISQKI